MTEIQVLELTLTGLAYGGDAFGRDEDGRVVFVPFALPHERVRVEVVEAHRRWARAKLTEVLEPSARRAEPRCRHFGVCGGCHYQHMPYEVQLEAKTEIVHSQLVRLGGFPDPPVEPTVASRSPWNTRNHIQFSLTPEARLGFVAAGAHRVDGTSSGSAHVVAVEECHLPALELDDLWPRIDLDAIPGLNGVALRAGADSERMIVLHAETDPDVDLSIDLPASVVWLGPGGAAVLAGDGHLWVEVNGRRFRVSAASFFQVHTGLAGELVRRALRALAIRSGETAFDLYAGVGLFSAFIAEAGAKLVAVEESPWACADFEINLDPFEGVELYEASVEETLPALEARPDAVLVDPPRAGLGRRVTDAILELAPPRLVYVSCDPATLARDGRQLADGGYHLERVTPIDLFPQTYHVETISLWHR